MAAVGPALGGLRAPPVAVLGAVAAPRGANRAGLFGGSGLRVGLLAVAAAAVASLLLWPAADPAVTPPDASGVAELDGLELSIADEPFDEGFDSLLDDFAALEADLATL